MCVGSGSVHPEKASTASRRDARGKIFHIRGVERENRRRSHFRHFAEKHSRKMISQHWGVHRAIPGGEKCARKPGGCNRTRFDRPRGCPRDMPLSAKYLLSVGALGNLTRGKRSRTSRSDGHFEDNSSLGEICVRGEKNRWKFSVNVGLSTPLFQVISRSLQVRLSNTTGGLVFRMALPPSSPAFFFSLLLRLVALTAGAGNQSENVTLNWGLHLLPLVCCVSFAAAVYAFLAALLQQWESTICTRLYVPSPHLSLSASSNAQS